ncbi:CLUMA_CG007728, isoform A [Clunio marinus]|uniref:CLUMA_CG007728, isoform A n=1 Tax=Clunio marinus TaxID=568069 RepID=A0A1J1I1Q0_9DIPT|nr:CLUMA_CG007728, isoform A [Clunio marinus]
MDSQQEIILTVFGASFCLMIIIVILIILYCASLSAEAKAEARDKAAKPQLRHSQRHQNSSNTGDKNYRFIEEYRLIEVTAYQSSTVLKLFDFQPAGMQILRMKHPDPEYKSCDL